jgi:type I restriction enzyme S subunit
MRSGGTPLTSVRAYYEGDIPWVSISDMSSSRKYINVTERYLTDEGLKNSAAVLFPPQTLLYAMYASIGECCISTSEMATSQAILGIQCGESLNVEFLFYVLQSRRAEVVRSGQQGTQANLNAQMVREMCIPLPAAPEQRAIAGALSDADAVVESLDALIAKKCDMKQAAMQQLLTGRTRLPGYTGGWMVTKLDEVLTFEVGFPFNSGQFHPYDGLRLVRNADLKSDTAVVCFRGTYPANYLVTNGDLLVGMDGDFVAVLWKGGDALLNQRVGRVKTTVKADTSYMSFALLEPLKTIERMTSATTVKHLSHSDVVAIRIPLPGVEEQRAIADVLSDMDAEIDALVARREKAELMKQGMMQELLSGRVRLL